MPRSIYLAFFACLQMTCLSPMTHGDDANLVKELHELKWLIGSWKHYERTVSKGYSRRIRVQELAVEPVEDGQAIQITYHLAWEGARKWSYCETIRFNSSENRLVGEYNGRHVLGREESTGTYALKRISENEWSGLGERSYKIGRKEMKTEFRVTRESKDAFDFASSATGAGNDLELNFTRLPVVSNEGSSDRIQGVNAPN